MRTTYWVACGLVISGSLAFLAAVDALSKAEDARGLYWGILGFTALGAAVRLTSRRGALR